MTVLGHIERGAVVFDSPVSLPEGTRVEIRVVSEPKEALRPNPELLKYAGIADDLPADSSQSIDRILYGTPPE